MKGSPIPVSNIPNALDAGFGNPAPILNLMFAKVCFRPIAL